jgi:hypothetical protein
MASTALGALIDVVADPVTPNLSAISAIEAGVGNIDAVARRGGAGHEGEERDDNAHVEE